MARGQTLRIEVGSEKLLALLDRDKTFLGAHGGRGGLKSWFFGDLHIARALSQPGYRALGLREVQKSIKESSKRLLEQRIQFYNVGYAFDVMDQEIRTPGGGVIAFHGAQNHTAESIKSFEDFDVFDIEEAQTIRQRSLDLLIPTLLRKPGAQMWARWNPRFDTDAIDMMFRGATPPQNSACVETSYLDNPWLSDEMKAQIAADYADDPEKAEHVWGGGYEIITEGAYYARLIAEAEHAGRIGEFAYDPSLPVKTGWDIGVDDYTAIWFFQENGRDIRAIDYYETSGDGAEQIVADALESKPYRYAAHFMPHDVMVREWGAGARSRFQTLRNLGVENIRVGVQQGPAERINASRQILPSVTFDKAKCALGIKRLRNYRRRWNESGQTFMGPLHDQASHGADGFGEFAINCQIIPPKPVAPPKTRDRYERRRTSEAGNWKTA
jgi:phage terminase large subunit